MKIHALWIALARDASWAIRRKQASEHDDSERDERACRTSQSGKAWIRPLLASFGNCAAGQEALQPVHGNHGGREGKQPGIPRSLQRQAQLQEGSVMYSGSQF